MSEMLAEVPPEYRQPVATGELPDFNTPEFGAEFNTGYGPIEKAVADVAIEGSGLVDVSTNSIEFGEQLSIENEPSIGWPVTDAEKGNLQSVVPKSNYAHPPEMSALEEAKYTSDYITREKAHGEWTSGKIDWVEFDKRVADKNPRTYQQPLLRQDGQIFEQEQPVIANPNIEVGVEDGTFWHGSNQLMEVGDRVLPSAEVPSAVHEANNANRMFQSSSSLKGSSHEDEKDFAFGHPRDAGYLPTSYGEHIYKVASPNSKIVPTVNGPEVWAEGGGTVVKRMHPDFAVNYKVAEARANPDRFQPGLSGMENGLQFVPEAELDVSRKEFYEKHLNEAGEVNRNTATHSTVGPEDVPLPGLEEHGKHQDISTTSSGSLM